jgi:ferredoxin
MESQPDAAASYAVTLLMPTGRRTISVPADAHIWDAALAAGVVLPALCHQGHCLTCAGRIEGAGDFNQDDSEAYFPADREAGYILLCTAKPLSNLRINTHCQEEMRNYRLSRGLPAPYA